MVRSGPGRDSPAYRQARAQLRREAPPICAGCGKEINKDLPKEDPMSWTADHEPDIATLITLGLDPDSIDHLRPMHRKCNGSKGNRRPKPPLNVSRVW